MLTRELGAGTVLSPEPPGPLVALPPLLLPSAPPGRVSLARGWRVPHWPVS